ncbi:hypothetical protein BDW22DRAFT_975726 [Trametopsis cervina]|nr:hypothetical protein BDW22DRAFT_975726 [Trametopsis cervina]
MSVCTLRSADPDTKGDRPRSSRVLMQFSFVHGVIKAYALASCNGRKNPPSMPTRAGLMDMSVKKDKELITIGTYLIVRHPSLTRTIFRAICAIPFQFVLVRWARGA